MTKNEFNEKFRAYARTLSPQQSERDLIAKIYKSLTDILGINNCIQIGSYPRFTSITPVHDLDVLYILGEWDVINNPGDALQALKNFLEMEYENPTESRMIISLQTHSVTIAFSNNNEEKLSIDIVPAYIFGANKFQQDMYKVPEIIKEKKHGRRKLLYENIKNENRDIRWIKTDPRGYIKVASEIDNRTDGEFRKTVKFIKKWSKSLKQDDSALALKSFHV